MKVLVTGGHPTPALAVIEYCRQAAPDIMFTFVGRTVSQQRGDKPATEQQQVAALGIQFIPFNPPKWSPPVWQAHNWLLPVQFITAVLDAKKIVAALSPDVCLAFGSYVAVPLAVACYQLKIPVITHEQTLHPGLSTQLISKLAAEVWLATAAAEPFLKRPTTVVGQLLRPVLFVPASAPSWLPANLDQPLLYITGGSQGSRWINQTVQALLPHLLKHWTVIHQCGTPSLEEDWLQQLSLTRPNYPADWREHYTVRSFLTSSEVAWVLQHSLALMSRAGANTVAELAAFQLPAILIPLPTSRYQEQQQNAHTLAHQQGVILLDQVTTTLDELEAALGQLHQSALLAKPLDLDTLAVTNQVSLKRVVQLLRRYQPE